MLDFLVFCLLLRLSPEIGLNNMKVMTPQDDKLTDGGWIRVATFQGP